MQTPKQRMLNAYKGFFSDFIPVAPEFWYFYPAKVLGVTMAEFQRDIQHWQGMLATFKKFNADGWGIASADEIIPEVKIEAEYKKISPKTYRDRQILNIKRKELERSYIFHDETPFWAESYAVKDFSDVDLYVEAFTSSKIEFDFKNANEGLEKVGEDFLLEFNLGLPFFDFFYEMMGFENAALFFMTEDEKVIEKYYNKFLVSKKRLLQQAIEKTKYEAYFIGCSSSCNVLEGPVLWRKWDKPYLKAMTDEVHRYGKLIHNHNHGKIMETVPDLVEIGFDCVCPFERDPGDVNGIDGLKKVRKILDNKVTFNGNVHTVQALIQGTPEIVKEQVREIKEAFAGSARFIIGTGDQVGVETPEENIYAMIEEGRKSL